MALQSGFFRSIGGDRRYNAEFFASYFSSFIGNGVFPNPSTGLQVIASSNLDVNVQQGKGWINGYYLVNTDNYTLTLDAADGSLSRIDRIVIGWNAETRLIDIYLKKGVSSTNPVAPTLQRDATIYELALADVRINNGLTAIAQANITDQRFNASLCGIVSGVVNQIDTTNLFAQYQNEFDSFFAGLQDILDENVAANLTNRILSIENSKGQNNGYASLNENGIVPNNQLPNISSGRLELLSTVNLANLSFVELTNLNLEDYQSLTIEIVNGRSTGTTSTQASMTFNGISTNSYFYGVEGGNAPARPQIILGNVGFTSTGNPNVMHIEISNNELNKQFIVRSITRNAADAYSPSISHGVALISPLISSINITFARAVLQGTLKIMGVRK